MPSRRLALGVLALLLLAGLVHVRAEAAREPKAPWGRNHFPAFDAYVYAAMAESPSVFTLAPWGYRLLTPLLVHALPARDPVKRFEQVARAGLVLAAGLLALWVHALGFRPAAAFAAAVALVASEPVSAALRHPFLAEPLALATFLALCLALERGAPWGLVALAAATGALAKETIFFALPVAVHVGFSRGGARPALRALVAAGGPMLAVTALLRGAWAPHLGAGSGPGLGADALAVALLSIVDHVDLWWRPLLLAGVLPLAVIGAAGATGRAYLHRYGLSLLALLALPFAAAVYPGEAGFAGFFAADIPRLLLYALPLLWPLALQALDRALPQWRLRSAPPAAIEAPRPAAAAAWLAVVALVAGLGGGLDRYRRADLAGLRDGPWVLGFTRESLRAAARLERGLAVELDPVQQRFAWGVSDPVELSRLRWPLRDGWGPLAHYGLHDIRLRSASAALVVPVYTPTDLRLALRFAATTPARLRVLLNGKPVGEAGATERGAETVLTLPASGLFRGDNELRLMPLPGALQVRLLWAGWERAATSAGAP
ncbi:MAG: hypothetical protein NDJ94_15605 [Vicinamibacteria bacterium]|nr:hypothetical protein [Vicinamibacteria bacterium]